MTTMKMLVMLLVAAILFCSHQQAVMAREVDVVVANDGNELQYWPWECQFSIGDWYPNPCPPPPSFPPPPSPPPPPPPSPPPPSTLPPSPPRPRPHPSPSPSPCSPPPSPPSPPPPPPPSPPSIWDILWHFLCRLPWPFPFPRPFPCPSPPPSPSPFPPPPPTPFTGCPPPPPASRSPPPPAPAPTPFPGCSASDKEKVKKCMFNTTSIDACCTTFKSILGTKCPCYQYAEDLDNQVLITLEAYCDVDSPCTGVRASY